MLHAHICREMARGTGYRTLVKDFRRAVVLAALLKAGGNKSRAARLLGVHRNNLDNWLKEFREAK